MAPASPGFHYRLLRVELLEAPFVEFQAHVAPEEVAGEAAAVVVDAAAGLAVVAVALASTAERAGKHL